MIAVLTGDIINSAQTPVPEWLPALKSLMGEWGGSPGDWEIYRGDELQLRLPPNEALRAAVCLKALMRSREDMDIRLAIGIGMETYRGQRVSESNGEAYQRSGRAFENLNREKTRLKVSGGVPAADKSLNLMLRLGLQFMDSWSRVSAETVSLALAFPEASQETLARQLDIRQSAVSQRQTRARLDLVMELLDYYREDYLKQIGCFS